MRTIHELRKDGSVWVYHATTEGFLKWEHPKDKECETCDGKRPAKRLPDVRNEGK